MKKRIFALIVAVIFTALPLCVLAESEYSRLQDIAELLTEEQQSEITAKLNETSEKLGIDMAILTVDTIEEGLTAEQDATEWYEYLGYGENGVMLYISIEDGEYYMLTSGTCIDAIGDKGIDYVSDEFIGYLSDGDFAGAFDAFITYTEDYLTTDHDAPQPFNPGITLIISIAVGFIVSLIVTGIWKSGHNSVYSQQKAQNYIKPGSLDITDSRVFFLYKKLDRTEKQNDSDNDTHKSSSGKTYGGGGGKF